MIMIKNVYVQANVVILCAKKCFETYKNCPICAKPLVRIDNFMAREIYAFLKKTPMIVFDMWWNRSQNPSSTGRCSTCHKYDRILRWCITCEKDLKNSEAEWRRPKIEPNTDLQKELIKVSKERFRFGILANRVICSDCFLEHHAGHRVIFLDEMISALTEYSISDSATHLVQRFLWREIEERRGKCLLRTMRMKRAFLKLFYLACDSDLTDDYNDLPKFFERLDDWKVPDGYMEKVRKNLEHQFASANVPWKDCECRYAMRIMNDMFSFKNQIEKLFVSIVNDLDLHEITECPFKNSQITDMLQKTKKMVDIQLYKLYTLFCWNNYKDGVFELFNNSNRLPTKCCLCKMSTCAECWDEEPHKCGICDDATTSSRTDPDIVVLELVKHYKENCISLLEAWWECDAAQLGFCLNCASYTEDLEICVYCELDVERSALKTEVETSAEFTKDMQLRFTYKGLSGFPMRWQCSDCTTRHRKPTADVWNKGCNHFRYRSMYASVSSECFAHNHKSPCLRLKEIKNYDLAMKAATFGLVFKIIKEGIKEHVGSEHARKEILET